MILPNLCIFGETAIDFFAELAYSTNGHNLFTLKALFSCLKGACYFAHRAREIPVKAKRLVQLLLRRRGGGGRQRLAAHFYG